MDEATNRKPPVGRRDGMVATGPQDSRCCSSRCCGKGCKKLRSCLGCQEDVATWEWQGGPSLRHSWMPYGNDGSISDGPSSPGPASPGHQLSPLSPASPGLERPWIPYDEESSIAIEAQHQAWIQQGRSRPDQLRITLDQGWFKHCSGKYELRFPARKQYNLFTGSERRVRRNYVETPKLMDACTECCSWSFISSCPSKIWAVLHYKHHKCCGIACSQDQAISAAAVTLIIFILCTVWLALVIHYWT